MKAGSTMSNDELRERIGDLAYGDYKELIK